MTEQLNIAELRKIAADFAECERHIDDLIPGAPLLTTPAATALRALPALLDAAEERDALKVERDEWKALYQTAIKHAAKKPF